MVENGSNVSSNTLQWHFQTDSWPLTVISPLYCHTYICSILLSLNIQNYNFLDDSLWKCWYVIAGFNPDILVQSDLHFQIKVLLYITYRDNCRFEPQVWTWIFILSLSCNMFSLTPHLQHPLPQRPIEWLQQMPASSHSDCLVLQV